MADKSEDQRRARIATVRAELDRLKQELWHLEAPDREAAARRQEQRLSHLRFRGFCALRHRIALAVELGDFEGDFDECRLRHSLQVSFRTMPQRDYGETHPENQSPTAPLQFYGLFTHHLLHGKVVLLTASLRDIRTWTQGSAQPTLCGAGARCFADEPETDRYYYWKFTVDWARLIKGVPLPTQDSNDSVAICMDCEAPPDIAWLGDAERRLKVLVEA